MVGSFHSLLASAMPYLNGLTVEFTVDGSTTRWRGWFEIRQGNNLDMGGFTQDFSGDGRVTARTAQQMEAAGTPLQEGLRLNVYMKEGGGFRSPTVRQLQIRDLDIQPSMWVFSLASPNQ